MLLPLTALSRSLFFACFRSRLIRMRGPRTISNGSGLEQAPRARSRAKLDQRVGRQVEGNERDNDDPQNVENETGTHHLRD